MKASILCSLPLAFSFCFAAAHASDVQVNAGVSIGNHKGHEYRMKVSHRGDHYYGVYNNHEYILRGDAVARINAEGEYTVYGDISPDSTYVDTNEFVVVEQPRKEVIVEQPRREVIVEQPRREVIVEQPRREVIVERHEPFIKVGPVKIGD